MRSLLRALVPLRVAYPLSGVMLALVLALGLLLVRLATADAPLSFEAAAREVVSSPITYAYVVAAAAALLVTLGWALGAEEDQLRTTSLTDPLTRIANRRHFEASLAEEIRRAKESGMPLALLLVDLDHLKQVNDSLGHAAGDGVLRLLAEVIRAATRSRDITARFGGDEFAVVMPRTRASEAWALAERVRASLATAWRTSPIRTRVPMLTASIGIADLESADADSAAGIFEAADRALYAAKGGGRDRTVIASQLDDTLSAILPAVEASAGGREPTGDTFVAPACAPSSCDEPARDLASARHRKVTRERGARTRAAS